MTRSYQIFAIFCLAFFPALLQAATLSASADRTVIGVDETLQLTVRLDQQVGYGGPDFGQLERDFEVLSQQRANQFRSVNGRTEAFTEWSITLAPRREGKLIIPSFTYEDAHSDAIEITVNEAGVAADGTRDIFIEVSLNKEQVYVQEQILLTMRLHTLVSLREINLAELEIPDAIVESLGETRFNKVVGGNTYVVMEVAYAIYPQKSGDLTIPSLNWDLVLHSNRSTWFNDPFQSARGSLRRMRSESKTVDVVAKPASYTGQNWMPAQELSLEQHWSSNPSRFVVGEPLTRTVTLTAKGLGSAQLAPLPAPDVEGMKVYSDQPQFDDMKSNEGITGHRIETFAMVPTRAGEMTLPALRVTWWDVDENKQKLAVLPPVTVNVAPAPASSRVPAPPMPESGTSAAQDTSTEDMAPPIVLKPTPWIVSTVVSTLLAIIFFVAWVKARAAREVVQTAPAAKSKPGEQAALEDLRKACGRNDARAARQALGHWGQRYWQLRQIASMDDIKQLSQDQALAEQLRELDLVLYSNPNTGSAQSWRGEPLWRSVAAFKRSDKNHHGAKSATSGQSRLPPLYPA